MADLDGLSVSFEGFGRIAGYEAWGLDWMKS
jgi:hypothetical protein